MFGMYAVKVFSPFCLLGVASAKENKVSGLCVGTFHQVFYL